MIGQQPVRRGLIVGGQVLTGDGDLIDGALGWDGGHIDIVGDESRAGGRDILDAGGMLILPGIVDLHGDAFERSLMPRSGVGIPMAMALAENDRHLVGSGITTFFVSVTDSWEPGLRSRDTLRTLLAELHAVDRSVDHRLHVRHEVCNTDDFDELVGWLSTGEIDLLSINDHAPGGTSDAHVQRASAAQIGRTGMPADDLDALLYAAAERRPTGLRQAQALSQHAHERGVLLASHDALSIADLERDCALGVGMAEFPADVELALRYRKEDIAVLLGAPNLVRGGSHVGGLSVANAIEADAVDALCSDYHYPSLLNAPFVMAARSGCSLATAWPLVSSAPARIAGLSDRGSLAVGARADVIVVRPPEGRQPAHVVAAVSGGRVIFREAP